MILSNAARESATGYDNIFVAVALSSLTDVRRLILGFSMLLTAIVSAAVPEPDVVFYGRVTRSPLNTAYVPAGVTWSLSGNAETLAASKTTVVSVNGESFYLTRIPFETRQLADNTPLPATPNTLSLPAAATPYTRSATVDGRPAILPAGTGSFSYGAATQGLIERLDLVIGETFAEWSQRLFGSVVSQTADADGDGRTNYQEYVAGTDPQNPASAFRATSIVPAGANSVAITWRSIAGKSYFIDRSFDFQTWTTIAPVVLATNPQTTFTDSAFPSGQPKVFYRISVRQ